MSRFVRTLTWSLGGVGLAAALGCAGSGGADDSGSAVVDDPASLGLWVWDTQVAGDEAATADLLAFCADRGVDTLFLSCEPVGYGEEGAVERYTALVDAAHAANVQVFAVSGSPWFSVPCDAGLDGQETCWTEGWDVYAACAGSGVGFDGIMDDTEPGSTPDGSWGTDYAQRAAWHVEYLEGVRERIGDLPFHHAVSAFYDELEPLDLDGSGATETLDVWISRVVDVMGVMAYRDSAADVVAAAEGELREGKVWIGVETGASSEGEDVTFADDGAAALDDALDALGAVVGADPNLEGLMVDSYETWRTLGDGS